MEEIYSSSSANPNTLPIEDEGDAANIAMRSTAGLAHIETEIGQLTREGIR